MRRSRIMAEQFEVFPMPTIEDISTPNAEPVQAHGRSNFVNELIITESKTKYGRAFSFFRNMDATRVRRSIDTVRPRRNLHDVQAWTDGNYNPYRGQDNTLLVNTPVYRLGNLEKVHQLNSYEEKIHESPKKKQPFYYRLYEQFDLFCDKSTLHGLRYVGDNTISTFERIFWFISFVTAMAFAIYFISTIYNKFNDNPVIVSFSPTMVSINTIPFPAITICNVNIAMKAQAERINQFGSEVDKKLLADMCNKNNSFPNDTDSDETADWTTVRKFIISINQKCSDMFKSCKWGNEEIDCEEYINSILTDEGFCCSFNRLPLNYSLRDPSSDDTKETYPKGMVDWNPEEGYPESSTADAYPRRSLGPGTHLGLTLVLDADLDEYYCTSTNSLGFKVLLSNPIERPKVADLGFLISPGDESRITVFPIIQTATPGVKSIDIDKRQCFFARERYLQFYRLYSERNCRLECQANYTLAKCGCVPYFLPKNISTRICDKNLEYCSNQAKFVIEKFTPERLLCNCLPGCFEISYEKKSASVGKINKKHNNTINSDIIKDIPFEYFVEHCSIVHFFFDVDKFTKQVKSELYGFSEFLSNTGGLLGLFLGFSFLSGVEIVYFIILKTTCDFYNDRKESKKVQKQGQVESGRLISNNSTTRIRSEKSRLENSERTIRRGRIGSIDSEIYI